MAEIRHLTALEILDSRGRPTLSVSCELAGGARASAQVPSGASTGKAEAVELRDNDRQRHQGLGCRKAVAQVTGPISTALMKRSFADQAEIDLALIALDGTPNKSRLGANTMLAVSLAYARSAAVERGIPLYEHFADMLGETPSKLPRLTVNLFSGGKHAGAQVPIQDVLVVPSSCASIAEGLEAVCAIYQAAAEWTQTRYASRPLTADEGGLAPPFENVADMFDDTISAIQAAGLQPGKDIHIAVDVAASHFFQNGSYFLDDETIDGSAMIERVTQWQRDYPMVSLEDPLAEDDWSHWSDLRSRLDGRALLLGDDLLCTNPERIKRAIDLGACDALLLKVNQIGTLTEALQALRLVRSAGWQVTISARSGETEDCWLADLAVGWAGDQIKVGSVTQSERLAKYNRLLAIEDETGLPVVAWPSASRS